MSVQLSNDPTLSSLPLLSTFLKSYARPYLGITPQVGSKSQIPEGTSAGSLAADVKQATESFPQLGAAGDEDELVEKETRTRFKRMCEGYFESVSKKLVIEHKVCLSQLYPFNVPESVFFAYSACKTKIVGIMRRILDPERYLKIASNRTRR